MRKLALLPCILAFVPMLTEGATVDPKALARFDLTYVRCEAQMPRLRGHRDAAYLGMWSPKVHDKVRGQLTVARNGPVYGAERQRIKQAAAQRTSGPAPRADAEECKTLLEEVERIAAVKK
ncbi:MAG: hypothetical protein EXR39_04830 [Betaproteobacteria bacterium]|nr:hypothetical protein [Betaproteobacteria bacterium]